MPLETLLLVATLLTIVREGFCTKVPKIEHTLFSEFPSQALTGPENLAATLIVGALSLAILLMVILRLIGTPSRKVEKPPKSTPRRKKKPTRINRPKTQVRRKKRAPTEHIHKPADFQSTPVVRSDYDIIEAPRAAVTLSTPLSVDHSKSNPNSTSSLPSTEKPERLSIGNGKNNLLAAVLAGPMSSHRTTAIQPSPKSANDGATSLAFTADWINSSTQGRRRRRSHSASSPFAASGDDGGGDCFPASSAVSATATPPAASPSPPTSSALSLLSTATSERSDDGSNNRQGGGGDSNPGSGRTSPCSTASSINSSVSITSSSGSTFAAVAIPASAPSVVVADPASAGDRAGRGSSRTGTKQSNRDNKRQGGGRNTTTTDERRGNGGKGRARSNSTPSRKQKTRCNFCANAGEGPAVVYSHSLRVNGVIVCPKLRGYKCPICGALGQHSKSYCPQRNSTDASGMPPPLFCKVCMDARDPAYNTHSLRDSEGRVSCPRLRAVVCATCGATGDVAHTPKYCPERKQQRQQRQQQQQQQQQQRGQVSQQSSSPGRESRQTMRRNQRQNRRQQQQQQQQSSRAGRRGGNSSKPTATSSPSLPCRVVGVPAEAGTSNAAVVAATPLTPSVAVGPPSPTAGSSRQPVANASLTGVSYAGSSRSSGSVGVIQPSRPRCPSESPVVAAARAPLSPFPSPLFPSQQHTTAATGSATQHLLSPPRRALAAVAPGSPILLPSHRLSPVTPQRTTYGGVGSPTLEGPPGLSLQLLQLPSLLSGSSSPAIPPASPASPPPRLANVGSSGVSMGMLPPARPTHPSPGGTSNSRGTVGRSLLSVQPSPPLWLHSSTPQTAVAELSFSSRPVARRRDSTMDDGVMDRAEEMVASLLGDFE